MDGDAERNRLASPSRGRDQEAQCESLPEEEKCLLQAGLQREPRPQPGQQQEEEAAHESLGPTPPRLASQAAQAHPAQGQDADQPPGARGEEEDPGAEGLHAAQLQEWRRAQDPVLLLDDGEEGAGVLGYRLQKEGPQKHPLLHHHQLQRRRNQFLLHRKPLLAPRPRHPDLEVRLQRTSKEDEPHPCPRQVHRPPPRARHQGQGLQAKNG
mmetsp:Transcript_13234/g.22457  ORF Transcript_13234/g.22457 Transcript_13234/m.22457 type:complete len:211 (+) Transcript_13234:259-891(+)